MSINPVAGATGAPAQAPAAAKPESAEVPGAPDRDGDSDDSKAAAPAGKITAGHVNIKA